MEVRTFDGVASKYSEYVRQARRELLLGIDAHITESGVAPLKFATYLGLFIEDVLAGFSESYSYDDAFGGYDGSPFSAYVDLNAFCPSYEMAHIRTAYLDPKYRKRSVCFVHLYLYTAKVFFDKGIRFSTLITTGNPYLVLLYERMGAKKLCSTTMVPEQLGVLISLYIVDLCALLCHPFAIQKGLNTVSAPMIPPMCQ